MAWVLNVNLTIIGGLCLLVGLVAALASNRYAAMKVLLAEPAEGLSPLVVRAVREWILRLQQSGMSILLSEQNVRFAMEVSDRAYVIDKGVIRHQGSMEELRANEKIRKRYLMV